VKVSRCTWNSRQAVHLLLSLPGHTCRADLHPLRGQAAFRRGRGAGDRYIAAYIAGKLDRVEVAYMKFLTPPASAGGGNAAAVVGRVRATVPSARGQSPAAPPTKKVEYEFPAPAPRTSLEEILPYSFKVRLLQVLF